MSKGLVGWLVEEGTRAMGRAAGTVLSDPRGQEAVARAVGLAQRGLQALGGLQEDALHAFGLAARPDYDEVRKRLARIKRKMREIDRKVGGRPGGERGGGRGDGPPGGADRR
jgi:hypothetical protein